MGLSRSPARKEMTMLFTRHIYKSKKRLRMKKITIGIFLTSFLFAFTSFDERPLLDSVGSADKGSSKTYEEKGADKSYSVIMSDEEKRRAEEEKRRRDEQEKRRREEEERRKREEEREEAKKKRESSIEAKIKEEAIEDAKRKLEAEAEAERKRREEEERRRAEEEKKRREEEKRRREEAKKKGIAQDIFDALGEGLFSKVEAKGQALIETADNPGGTLTLNIKFVMNKRREKSEILLVDSVGSVWADIESDNGNLKIEIPVKGQVFEGEQESEKFKIGNQSPRDLIEFLSFRITDPSRDVNNMKYYDKDGWRELRVFYTGYWDEIFIKEDSYRVIKVIRHVGDNIYTTEFYDYEEKDNGEYYPMRIVAKSGRGDKVEVKFNKVKAE